MLTNGLPTDPLLYQRCEFARPDIQAFLRDIARQIELLALQFDRPRILDVGIGTGVELAACESLHTAHEVVGIDINEEYLREAKMNLSYLRNVTLKIIFTPIWSGPA
jgi:protein-L-isoaspartate O-methyltransferase